MALSEFELKVIENTVGRMCQRRSPPHLSEKVKIIYKIVNYSVEVYEQRPRWNNPKEQTNTPVAKFLYTRTTKKWKLYWMRKDLKWHLYKPVPESTRIEKLVEEVDEDPYSTFFG